MIINNKTAGMFDCSREADDFVDKFTEQISSELEDCEFTSLWSTLLVLI